MTNTLSDFPFFDPLIAGSLAHLPLNPRRPMIGTVSGRHKSPHKGSSVEFAEYRRYVPGDDLRRLDWRAYGRTDRYYIKEFEADTNLRCVLVMDSSRSMLVGSPPATKWFYAKQLASTLIYLALQQGDACGLVAASNAIEVSLPAKRNPAHLSTLLESMNTIQPNGETMLPQVLHELSETVKQRAFFIIISDFFLPAEEWKEPLEHLRFRKHDVALFQLIDREEVRFDIDRPTRFVDMETSASIFVDPVKLKSRYLESVHKYFGDMLRVTQETHASYRRIVTDAFYADEIKSFLIQNAA